MVSTVDTSKSSNEHKKRRVIRFFAILFVFLAVTATIIFFARGFRFDFKERKLERTGILSVSTTPNGAAIYINDDLKDASNATIQNLQPGKYKVRLTKEGYSSWEKEIEIKEEIVTPIEAVLFPSAPNLKAISFNGVVNPEISPDLQKIVYGINLKEREGLWILELANRPIIGSRDPRQIVSNTETLNFSNATLEWSPDSSKVLATLTETVKTAGKTTKVQRNYLLDAGRLNDGSLSEVSATLAQIKSDWEAEHDLKEKNALSRLSDEAKKLARESKNIVFSPDEDRLLLFKEDDTAVVYDSKPSPVPDTKPAISQLPKAQSYIWYPDSKHVILVENGAISIVEVGGQNKMGIYTGSFDPKAVFPWPDGSKLIISTTLNTAVSKEPNLYSIDLR